MNVGRHGQKGQKEQRKRRFLTLDQGENWVVRVSFENLHVTFYFLIYEKSGFICIGVTVEISL